MANRSSFFELYRINVVHGADLFSADWPNIANDEDLAQVLKKATEKVFDKKVRSGKSVFEWSLREFSNDVIEDHDVVYVKLARSLIEREGQTVTGTAIEHAISSSMPPAAESIALIFFMSNHTVAVQYNSSMMGSNVWMDALREIIIRASESLRYGSYFVLEPLPEENEVFGIFQSFSRLTRLKVRLRIPNPEFDRKFQNLYEQMIQSKIREYSQDMLNPNGLSRDEGSLAFTVTAMAAAGYKKGDVIFTGDIDGKRQVIRTGNRPLRGRIASLETFIRGLTAGVRTKEAKKVLAEVSAEISRLRTPSRSPSGANEDELPEMMND